MDIFSLKRDSDFCMSNQICFLSLSLSLYAVSNFPHIRSLLWSSAWWLLFFHIAQFHWPSLGWNLILLCLASPTVFVSDCNGVDDHPPFSSRITFFLWIDAWRLNQQLLFVSVELGLHLRHGSHIQYTSCRTSLLRSARQIAFHSTSMFVALGHEYLVLVWESSSGTASDTDQQCPKGWTKHSYRLSIPRDRKDQRQSFWNPAVK